MNGLTITHLLVDGYRLIGICNAPRWWHGGPGRPLFNGQRIARPLYAALGRRLLALQRGGVPSLKSKPVVNTLRHGPKPVDAAVFASISPKDVEDLPEIRAKLERYEALIGDDRELALTLKPLIHRWREAATEQAEMTSE